MLRLHGLGLSPVQVRAWIIGTQFYWIMGINSVRISGGYILADLEPDRRVCKTQAMRWRCRKEARRRIDV